MSAQLGVTAPPTSVEGCRYALVVDDNTQARGQLVKLLRSLGILVDETSQAQQAITQLAKVDAENRPYDIVFIDWRMPEMNGQRLAEDIQQLPLRGLRPRLVLMASNVQGLPDHVDRSLFAAVMSKPVTPSELLDTVTRRVHPEHASKAPVSGLPVRWEGLYGRHILLVEDNPINQEVVHGLLDLVGARVSMARDGSHGIRLLQEHTFDLVLMDINMPVMNGFEAADLIKQDLRFANLPIIALTANALGGDRERCLAAGMSDYIAKPIDPNQMFPILLRHLPVAPKPQEPAHVLEQQAPVRNVPGNDVETMLAAVARIPGVNVTEAVSRMMGRRELYAKLVVRFVAERKGMLETLEQALHLGDRETMLDVIHNAKSMLGALGVEDLKHRAAALQSALSENGDRSETPHLEADISVFAADFAALLLRLKELTPSSA